MTSPLNGLKVPQLGGSQQVVIHTHTVLAASAVEIMDGGLFDPSATKHLRVLDLAHGVAYYAPLNPAQINALRENVK